MVRMVHGTKSPVILTETFFLCLSVFELEGARMAQTDEQKDRQTDRRRDKTRNAAC